MCGIFGYVGSPVKVGPVVLEALRSMEYRGYDSWGVAFTTGGGQGRVIKGVGRVATGAAGEAEATSAIGHTRWATHGAVCERNAHPHLGSDGRIAVVHNGIIENADRLRSELRHDHPFASETDSELMAHLVSQSMRGGRSLVDAVSEAFAQVQGNNAFVALDRQTGEIVVITSRLPIRLSRAAGALILASDPAALAGVAESTIAVPDNVAVSLGTPSCSSEVALELLASGRPIAVPDRRIAHEGEPGSSMRAEIAEQPEVVRRIARDVDAVRPATELARHASRVVFTGCGSASHAAMHAADLAAAHADALDAIAIPASELLGRPWLLREGDVLVALTQSGETADVIDAVSIARERGAATVGLINAEGSTVGRLVDVTVPLLAGHERSVLATKSYLAMLARAWQLASGTGGDQTWPDLWREADALDDALADSQTRNWVSALATALSDRSSAMVVTSGEHMPAGYEAALKIKEGSYVHAEAVRTGELKHGIIALIDEGFPCVLLASGESVAARLRIAAEELRSRGAAVFWLGEGAPACLGPVPGCGPLASRSPFVHTMVMQMVALDTAMMRGVDPDYPRNLAKSVTVR